MLSTTVIRYVGIKLVATVVPVKLDMNYDQTDILVQVLLLSSFCKWYCFCLNATLGGWDKTRIYSVCQ